MLPSLTLVDGRSGDPTSLLHLLDVSERTRLERMTAPGRRREFVLGRVLAKMSAAQIEAKDASSVTIAVADSGRPFYEGSDLQLSISHSHGWVAVAVGERELGLDIQTIVDELPARALGTGEARWVSSLDGRARAIALTNLWSIKEALGKLAGTGLRFPAPEIPVPLKQRDGDGSVHWLLFGNDEMQGAIATESTAELPTSIETLTLEVLESQSASPP